MDNYVSELLAGIKSSYVKYSFNVHYNLDITDKQIPIGLAIPLGLILNELITNAYKYAFTDSLEKEKKIDIRFHELENTTTYRLVVKDNGKGLPANFDVDKLSSFGLQLVYGLTEQLLGEIVITRDKGTTFTLLLKEPQEA